MSIHFDFTAMLDKAIGANGLTAADLDSLEPQYQRARGELKDKRLSGELPFWNLPFSGNQLEEVNLFAERAAGRFDNFVLLGIGGSALGPLALHAALNHPFHNLLPRDQRRGCRFFCLDNVDPDFVQGALDVCPPSRTLYNVVSKSGETAETMAQFLLVLEALQRELGDRWREHLVFTTDPQKGALRELARTQNIAAFDVPPAVGGRFTVLTPVGTLTAAMTGLDVAALLRGAGEMRDACFAPEFAHNPAAQLAALLYLSQIKRGRPIHVFFAYSNRLYPVADWMRQLWAESLGKRYDLDRREVFTGPTPVKALGATDQHSQVQLYVEGPPDKVIVFLGAKEFRRRLTVETNQFTPPSATYLNNAEFGRLLNFERQATAFALTEAGRPNMTIELDRVDEAHIGALLYLLEAATLYAGSFYHVNPLDQPGVEAGKLATFALMGREGYDDLRRRIQRLSGDGGRTLTLAL